MFDSNPATNILAGDGFPNSDLVATLITYPAILPQISPWIQIWTWQIWQLYPHLGMSKDRVPPNPIADNHCSPCLGHPPIFDKGTHFWLPKNPAPRRSSVWRSGLRRKAKSKRPNPCWPWPGRPGSRPCRGRFLGDFEYGWRNLWLVKADLLEPGPALHQPLVWAACGPQHEEVEGAISCLDWVNNPETLVRSIPNTRNMVHVGIFNNLLRIFAGDPLS